MQVGHSSWSCVMPGARRSVVFLISVSTAVVCVVLAFLLSIVGGVLNRGRGGYFSFNSTDYWASHAISRLVFAVPTGVVVVRKLWLSCVTLSLWPHKKILLPTYVELGQSVQRDCNSSAYHVTATAFLTLHGGVMQSKSNVQIFL